MSHLSTTPLKVVTFNQYARAQLAAMRVFGTFVMAAAFIAIPVVGWRTIDTLPATQWLMMLLLLDGVAMVGLFLRVSFRRKERQQLATERAINGLYDILEWYLAGSLDVGESRTFGTFDTIAIKVTRGSVSWFVQLDELTASVEPTRLFAVLVAPNRAELYTKTDEDMLPDYTVVAVLEDVRCVIAGQSELARFSRLVG